MNDMGDYMFSQYASCWSHDTPAGRVRILAVGFPVLFIQSGAAANVIRFAAFMRRLEEDNDGTFVGLNGLC